MVSFKPTHHSVSFERFDDGRKAPAKKGAGGRQVKANFWHHLEQAQDYATKYLCSIPSELMSLR